jgi:pimeloyl-ACP methyl ester carboxylesterase
MAATVVLVSGAWSGPWIWQEVVKELDGRGIPSRTVDLPTVGASGPSVDFRDDANAVRAVVSDVDGDVVLAANSYGGVVITEAALQADNVKRLVYLAAFMPDAGEPLLEFMFGNSYTEFGAGVQLGDDGLTRLDVGVALERAFQHAPPAQKDLVRANIGVPMSMGSDQSLTVTTAAWRMIPSTYLVCTEDLAIRPESQRQWAKDRAADYVEWPSDHCPQCSRPDDIADLLARLANDVT